MASVGPITSELVHRPADHFWLRHRHYVFDRHFKRRIRQATQIGEVGCGTGVLLQHLAQRYDKAADGFEIDPVALQQCPTLPGNLHLYDVTQRNPELLDRYDLLLVMNVLEQVDQELAFLQAVRDHLKPGGTLILDVRMRSQLHTAAAAAAGYQRRYAKQELNSLVQSAGLQIQEVVQWGHVYIPFLRLGHPRTTPELLLSESANRLLSWVRFLDHVIPPFYFSGAGAFLVAKRP